MRAKIVGMIVLTGIAALTTAFTAPAYAVTVGESAVRQLTEEEADCLLNAEATCIDVALDTADECLAEAGIFGSEIGDNLYNMVVGGWCAGSGIWAGATCAWDWFTDLF